jgi:hypothetical protein
LSRLLPAFPRWKVNTNSRDTPKIHRLTPRYSLDACPPSPYLERFYLMLNQHSVEALQNADVLWALQDHIVIQCNLEAL